MTPLIVDHYHLFFGHSPPTADSRKAGVSCKRMYVLEVLINRLVKLAVVSDMTIAVDWDVKHQSKLKTKICSDLISEHADMIIHV